MSDAPSLELRTQILKECGASDELLPALLAYNQNPFQTAPATTDFPLKDEAHVTAWSEYEKDAHDGGPFDALKRRIVQLRFPIRAGMSGEEAYRKATRKGLLAESDEFSPGLELHRPSDLELIICPTMAGRVPVLVAGDRSDFVCLVQAFAERNEPVPVPESMGACIVKGFNNWDRIATFRKNWEREHPFPFGGETWSEEFGRLISRKELYQDRFIILSRGPYSAVSAGDVGLHDEEWLHRSLVLRREHEFTHYFTYRLFDEMRNNLLDELIADFVGLQRAFGRYRADFALRFLGLESYPKRREGGRLEVYRGKPPLPDEGLDVLACLAFRVSHNLEDFCSEHTDTLNDLSGMARVTLALIGLTLEELASSEMRERAEKRLLS